MSGPLYGPLLLVPPWIRGTLHLAGNRAYHSDLPPSFAAALFVALCPLCAHATAAYPSAALLTLSFRLYFGHGTLQDHVAGDPTLTDNHTSFFPPHAGPGVGRGAERVVSTRERERPPALSKRSTSALLGLASHFLVVVTDSSSSSSDALPRPSSASPPRPRPRKRGRAIGLPPLRERNHHPAPWVSSTQQRHQQQCPAHPAYPWCGWPQGARAHDI